MTSDAKYLLFGLLVLVSYWISVQRGVVYWAADQAPSPPAAGGASASGWRSHPSFWSTGYQGGK